MFNETTNDIHESIISRGYFTQLTNEHVDQILALPPTKLLSLIKEDEPQLVELIISMFQKMYPQRDIAALVDNLLTQHNSRDAFALSMQKAFVDGAIVSYLLDHLSQKKVHEGASSADELLSKVAERVNKVRNANLDGLTEDEIRIQQMYEDSEQAK